MYLFMHACDKALFCEQVSHTNMGAFYFLIVPLVSTMMNVYCACVRESNVGSCSCSLTCVCTFGTRPFSPKHLGLCCGLYTPDMQMNLDIYVYICVYSHTIAPPERF